MREPDRRRSAAGCVDVCLIPEVPFALKGTKGLFAYVEKVLEERGHCVMCVAEGAGQVSVRSMLSKHHCISSPLSRQGLGVM